MTQALVVAGTLILVSVAGARSPLAAEPRKRAESAGSQWNPGRTPERGIHGGVTPSDADTSADGVYGRFDGDFTGALGLGGRVPFSGEPVSANLHATLYYYWSVGAYARYSDTLRDMRAGETRRSLGTGIELRPTFLLRWPFDLEQGPAWLDLLTDSVHASIGPVWVEPQHGERETDVEVGFGLGFPLMLSAAGLWLELRTALPLGTTHAESTLGLALAWHGMFTSPWQDP